jgi:uncharacterized integral membrane protein (TIGR00698 family)
VLAIGAVARLLTGALPGIISEITVGVLLGLIVGNLLAVGPVFRPGIRFAGAFLLRLGIVLLGARLAFGDILAIGAGSLLMVAAAMTLALGLTMALGRILRLPVRLVALIAVGTAICGNSAIVATAPVIEADDRDVSFAVATITIFGVLAVLVYPFVGHALGLSDPIFGHWAGVAVNDTSQVTATGFAYSEAAGQTATVVKLTRNTLMGPLIMVVGLLYARSGAARSAEGVVQASRLRFVRLVPLFVLGFLALAVVNSVGWLPAGAKPPIGEASRALILLALVGVGLNANLRQMRTVGLRPFYLGLGVASAVAVCSLGLAGLLVGG